MQLKTYFASSSYATGNGNFFLYYFHIQILKMADIGRHTWGFLIKFAAYVIQFMSTTVKLVNTNWFQQNLIKLPMYSKTINFTQIRRHSAYAFIVIRNYYFWYLTIKLWRCAIRVYNIYCTQYFFVNCFFLTCKSLTL